jgi:hypothetical protein
MVIREIPLQGKIWLGNVSACYEASKLVGPKLDFLTNWIKEYNKSARKYVDFTKNDAPYLYTEREMNGSLLIALSNFTDACISELYTRRKNGARRKVERTDKYGRVDFWTQVNKTEFYIETKHCFGSRNRNEPKADIVKRLNKAIQQLTEVRNNQGESKNLHYLAVETVVLKTMNAATNRQFSKEEWDDLIEKYKSMEIEVNKQKDQPDWVGMILFSDEVINNTVREDTFNNSWHYHGLLFIAKYL